METILTGVEESTVSDKRDKAQQNKIKKIKKCGGQLTRRRQQRRADTVRKKRNSFFLDVSE